MDKVKQMLEKVKKAVKIISKIPPPVYIGIAIFVLLILIVCLFCNFSEMGITSNAAETEGTGWWWPIGSAETTKEGGKLFASGTPVPTAITSGVGPRWGRYHNGIDIAPVPPQAPPGPYIIASKDGTVEYVIDGFSNNGYLENPDGGGYGNHIIINYGDGMKILYGHLSTNSIKVKVGDNVTYGQVIANMGHSGSSSATHLHFEMRLNGQVVDPEEYVDPNDPRPVTTVEYSNISGTNVGKEFVRVSENDFMRRYINGDITDYNSTAYIYYYITKDKQYYYMGNDLGCNRNGNYGFGVCFFVAPGSDPNKGDRINTRSGYFQNTEYFKDRGYDVRNDARYHQYYASKIPVGPVNEMEEQIFQEKIQYVKNTAANSGVTLNEAQIIALADFAYRGDPIIPVISALKNGATVTQNTAFGFQYSSESGGYYRGLRRWILFSKGKYLDASGKEIVVKSSSTTSNSRIISKAKEIHDYMVKNKYRYSLTELANTFQSSKSGKKVCCATYVSWVLQESGYLSVREHTNGATPLYSKLKNKGWKEVSSLSSAKPGDIFFYSTNSGKTYYHTDIYAGNKKLWNAGNPKDDGTFSTRSCKPG